MSVLTEYTGVNEDEITVHKGETVQVSECKEVNRDIITVH